MTLRANSPHSRDIAYHLHPYTNLVAHEKQGPHIMAKGDGGFGCLTGVLRRDPA